MGRKQPPGWLTYAWLLTLAFGLSTQAQYYSVDWFTIDGGGGTSTGGVYVFSGTIGQPDAGAMSGGNYTLQGGFWGIIAAIPTPGAPPLTITLNPELSSITVSWPAPATGWQLQQNTDLSTTNWTNAGATPQEVNGRLEVVLSPLIGSHFYRLYRP